MSFKIASFWSAGSTKVKHSTLIADYEKGGLKNVDVEIQLKAFKLT